MKRTPLVLALLLVSLMIPGSARSQGQPKGQAPPQLSEVGQKAMALLEKSDYAGAVAVLEPLQGGQWVGTGQGSVAPTADRGTQQMQRLVTSLQKFPEQVAVQVGEAEELGAAGGADHGLEQPCMPAGFSDALDWFKERGYLS